MAKQLPQLIYGHSFYPKHKKNDKISLTIEEQYGIEKSENSFIIAYDTHFNDKGEKKHKYALFDNVFCFLDWTKNVPQDKWRFYEMLHGKRKFCLDIDLIKHKNPELFDNIQQVIDGVLDGFVKLIPNLNISKDIMILSAHTETKKSLHIILQNYYCEDEFHSKDIYCELRNYISHVIYQVIDKSIYSKNRLFRTLFSEKLNANNFLKLESNFVYNNVSYTTEIQKNFGSFLPETQNLLYLSLCTTVNNNSILLHTYENVLVKKESIPNSPSVQERKEIIVQHSIDLSPQIIEK